MRKQEYLSRHFWKFAGFLCLLDRGSPHAYAAPATTPHMVYDWNALTPSTSLNWTPCFVNYTCTRLEVPLDYDDPAVGNTSLAFMKLSSANSSGQAKSILINQGGPGGSGVDFLLSLGPTLSQILGSEYDIVGFDPRGVNNSGPIVDCFLGDESARDTFNDLFFSEVTDSSSNSIQTQFYSSDLFGKTCTAAFQKNASGQYVSTPAVARDMLSYVHAEQVAAGRPKEDAKLFYYAVSYGTVLGSTYAALFPNNVGGMVLDGVLDAEDYYNLGWKTNIFQADRALGTFSTYCHQGGPQNCSFWGPSPQNITDRLDLILSNLKDNPIPVSGLGVAATTGLATYADLKQLALWALYAPVDRFPALSDALLGLENGNGSLVVGQTAATLDNSDVSTVVKCVDGYHGTNLSTLNAYEEYVKLLQNQSKYFGDAWSTNSDTVMCRSLKLTASQTTSSFSGFERQAIYNTSFPILFVSSAIDPATPSPGAYKMSKIFPGSVVLIQNSVGHTASASASACLVENIQAYLAGKVPMANTTCQPDLIPFRDPSSLG